MTKLNLLFFIFSSFYTFGQLAPGNKNLKTLNLTGQVLDSASSVPLEFVSVALIKKEDLTIIAGGVTDSMGNFKIGPFSSNDCILRLTFIGYAVKKIDLGVLTDDQKVINLGRISLKLLESVQELGEVKAQGQLEALKVGIEKRAYNVGEDINNAGGNAGDVLNNVPSIEVDQEGNISLRGDANVLILIDGRPSTLAGSLQTLLRTIPASNIERVEVVTNPSAKYDPDGTSGIINIVLKKNKLRGINGELSGTAATGNIYQGSAGLSVRSNKLNVFGNYGLNYNENKRNFNSTTTIVGLNQTAITLTQARPGDGLTESQTGRFGFDYALKPNQNIGASASINDSREFSIGMLTNELKDESGQILRRWNRRTSDPTSNFSKDVSMFYNWKFKEDKGELATDFRFSNSMDNKFGNYLERSEITNDEEDLSGFLNQHFENIEKNDVFSGQLDFTRVIAAKGIRIEAGVKQIIRNQAVMSQSESYDNTSNTWQSDTLANFDYKYEERILSNYLIIGQAVGKFKYQIGVRPEYSEQNPNLVSKNLAINNSYFNLFPSAHLRYNKRKGSEWGLSYSRRINRAKSNQLNPFTDYTDPNNLRMGNPNLQPEFINSFDLSYLIEDKKWTFSSSAFYRRTTEVIQRFKEFYPNNTSSVSFQNIDMSNSYGLEFIINYRPSRNFRNNLAINTDRIEYFDKSGLSTFTNSGYNFSIKYSGSYEFWKKTASVQINVRYNAPRITFQGTVLPRSAVDVSAQKKWYDGNLILGLRISDVFNTQEFRFDLAQNNTRQIGAFKMQTQRVYLTLTYRFGKYEMTKKNPGGDGNSQGFDF